MRVAIIHDWLVTIAGAEKVLSEILKLYPDADLYSMVDFLSDKEREVLGGKSASVSFIQKLPLAKSKYRGYLPLMPFAVEQFDLSSYDLVISSSYAVAKGVITGPNQLHICYCHSPMRYAWDLQHQYLRESGLEKGLKSYLVRWLLHKIRGWDYRTSNGVDHFISNSDYIGKRIQKVYNRTSTTIYPNVAVNDFELTHEKDDYYFTASRLVPYKQIDLIVRSFTKMPEKKLVVIGDGPQMKKITASAGNNVVILGYQDFKTLKSYMQKAKGFVFAAEEDFGIIPVEAQACGTPVIAYGKGGLLETVIDGKTGVFFNEQTEDSLIAAINDFEGRTHFDPDEIRANAERFSTEQFSDKLSAFITNAYADFRNS